MNKTDKNISPHVINRKICHKGKWLNFEKITYNDPKGITRTWENVQRTSTKGAAVVIATLIPSNRVILVRQFRPSINNYIIEFPAGLIDEGEDHNISALRELKEETGYSGKITFATVPVYNSPGLTDEAVAIVFANVDENDTKNIDPQPRNDDTEDIQVFTVEKENIKTFLEERQNLGDKIDSKLMIFALK